MRFTCTLLFTTTLDEEDDVELVLPLEEPLPEALLPLAPPEGKVEPVDPVEPVPPVPAPAVVPAA
jgi:hypothetical protein